MLSWDQRDAARHVVMRDGVTIGETTALEFLDDTAPQGDHRQMPAHEIHIYRNGQRNWFPVHRNQEASVLCLIGGGCPRAAITGSGVS